VFFPIEHHMKHSQWIGTICNGITICVCEDYPFGIIEFHV